MLDYLIELIPTLARGLASAVRTCFVVPLMFVLPACVTDDVPDTAPSVAPGDRLPQFSLTLSDGARLSTGDLAGSPSVIVFFNTSCADCQRELPVIDAVSRSVGSHAHFIAIAREESQESIGKFWQQHDMTMPYSPQSDRAIYSLFARWGIPQVFVADAALVVREVFGPDINLTPDMLEDVINSL